MASRFSITLQDAEGAAQTGRTVQLYVSGGALVGSFTDNGDGTYYIDVVSSGEYDVAISGEPTQDELQGIFIAVDDLSDHLADTNDPHDVQADQVDIDDSGGYFIGTDVEAALQELGAAGMEPAGENVSLTDTGGYFTTDNAEAALQQIGAAIDLNFADPYYLDDDRSISQNFERVDNVLRSLALNSNLQSFRVIYSEPIASAGTLNEDEGTTAYLTHRSSTTGVIHVKAKDKFLKRSGDTKLIVSAMIELTGSDITDADMHIQVGSAPETFLEALSFGGGGQFFYTKEINISGYTDNEYLEWKVGCYITTGSGSEVQMQNIHVEVQTN